ncbi:outer membrane lipoprotein-sorting protein [Myxococcota bacterium]|nr:outer membrane lipoprotein-sorting protein [Myxococcota bacterium]
MAGRMPSLAVVIVALALPAGVRAEELSAHDIAAKALENNTFSTSNARAEVALEVSKDGKVVRRRSITTKIKRDDAAVRSFVEFTAPADVAGTKFLSIEEKGKEADQFIYLPAFKKVKRVVGAQRSQSFMGTDFSYDDLDGRRVDDQEWKRLADEPLAGQDCYVIEGAPKTPGKGTYGRTTIWVHKRHLIPMRIDFFAADKATLKKKLTVRKLEKLHERWIASDSVMATVDKGTETRLEVKTVDFETAIADDEVSQRALER